MRNENVLPVLQADQGVSGSKDGKGIGDLADGDTITGWAREYFTAHDTSGTTVELETAFVFGARAEGRFAGQSFVEAEPTLRSEWSSEKGRLPWDGVRETIWAGFDRARDRRV